MFWVRGVIALFCVVGMLSAQVRKLDLQTQTKNVLPFDQSRLSYKVFSLREDFPNNVTTTKQIGTHGWQVVLGSGGSIVGASFTTVEHPGLIQIRSGTTINNQTILHLGSSTGSIFDPNAVFDSTWVLRAGDSTPITDSRYRLGFGDAVAGEAPTDGLYIETLSGDANWFGVCRASDTETRVDTGEVVATSWIRLRIRRIDASTIGFTAGSQSEVVCTTNVPTVVLNMFTSVKTEDTVNNFFTMDYMSLEFSVAR